MFNKQRKCLKDEKLIAIKTLIKEVQNFFKYFIKSEKNLKSYQIFHNKSSFVFTC